MGFQELDHVGFSVSDLDRSIRFYTMLLEAEPVGRLGWRRDTDAFLSRIVGYEEAEIEAAFWQLPGGTILELLCYSNPPTGTVNMETYNAGSGHLALRTSDIHSEFERLSAHAEFRGLAPVEIPSGPAKGGFAIYLRDPDGITIELVQAPPVV